MFCEWRSDDVLLRYYHDYVYGVLKTDSNVLFKWLTLEQAQAGLSWQTVINKEKAYDDFFDNFDLNKVANYDYEEALIKLQDSKIIKNKLKLKAVITSANLILKIEETQTFFNFLVSNIDESKTLDENVLNLVAVMKKLGFKFVGYEIIRSFLESVGIINNHETTCQSYTNPLFTLKI